MHLSLSLVNKGRWWHSYNVRFFVLLSLFLQVLLVLLGPWRKRNTKGSVILVIWGAFLLADWAASYALGLISSGEGKRYILDEDLAAFWAPFLLVHLGGQDTITAFSLEDNQLWLRRLLELLVHLGLVAYVFYQTIPNRFWISTVLMFCAGTIKYAERTRALYLACLSVFKAHVLPKPDPGPDYAQLMEEYSSYLDTGVPARFIIKKELVDTPTEYNPAPIEDIEVVKNGYKFYRIFRGLMVELVFSLHERNESRDFFFQRTFTDAFRVMEVELNFMYDVFYTKMNVVHRKVGYLFRFFSFLLIVISFFTFVTFHGHKLPPEDAAVSYTLFAGAFVLDFIALAKSVFSDWTLAWVEKPTGLRILSRIREMSLFKRSRWSNNMSQHNLISYCLEERSLCLDKVADFFGLREKLDEFLYKKPYTVKNDLKEFIFMELVAKATKASKVHIAKKIWSSKGNWVLSKPLSIQKRTMGHESECPKAANMLESVLTMREGHESKYSEANTREEHESECTCPETIILESVSDQVEFDESLLRWHIATELCYCTDSNVELDKYAKISKHISDYMLYLLVMRRSMMSAVAGIGQIRFADSCEEAKRFFQRGGENAILKPKNCCQSFMNFLKQIRPDKEEMRKKACEKLLSVNPRVNPVVIKGDKCQSLLFDGCRLARALIDIKLGAATHSTPDAATDSRPDAATDSRPNAAIPDAATDSRPDAATDIRPDAATDSKPDAATDSRPNAATYDPRKKWEIMSKVWVELLAYAATHIRPDSHGQQLNRGGELLTFVWLLMAHLGLGEQFRIKAGTARAKLNVG